MHKNTMTVRSVRNIETPNGTRSIVSLTAPMAVMAMADAKALYNSAEVDGEYRQYRPDVTLFVKPGIAAQISTALTDGKTLTLEATKEAPEDCIQQSKAGSYFVPAEMVMSDTKSLNFTVHKTQVADFADADDLSSPF